MFREPYSNIDRIHPNSNHNINKHSLSQFYWTRLC